VLLDTGGDSRWARENAPELLAQRGYSPAKVELVRRWFHGEFSPREYLPIFWRISGAYSHGSGWLALARELAHGGWVVEDPHSGLHLRRPPAARRPVGDGPPW
jgi:proline iminopeptidase